jgi:chromosome segregation ATPase
MTAINPDRLGKLESLLEQLVADQQATNTRLDRLSEDIEASNKRVDKWEERFLQLSRDNLIIARTVIVAAASVVILGSVLDKADVLVPGFLKALGKA